ncbi:MAG: twin-arginine translocase TatA/TatE family subunit [Deltaproteobacteria bacterium]|nr:twin-arginine translocase TatA/TatE family subunit [Deltaproteobacteria bacterium]
MSGIGWTELFIIGLILLIFVGPKRLPELFGKLAWVIAQIRSASRDLRNQIDSELTEIKQVKTDITREMIAQTDKLYAEAQQLDDEFKSLQDDVGDIKTELKEDLNDVGNVMTAVDSSSEKGEDGASSVQKNRELKG